MRYEVGIGRRVAETAAAAAESARHPVGQLRTVLLEELIDEENPFDVALAEREVMLRLQQIDYLGRRFRIRYQDPGLPTIRVAFGRDPVWRDNATR